MTTRSGLHVDAFGFSSKHALRMLLTEFRHRGWRDPGDAALLVVIQIEDHPGISPERAAAAAPQEFFDMNAIRRKDLAEALADMVRRP